MAEMLDISILNLDKAVVTENQIKDFLSTSMFIEEKLDGTKLTVIRNGEPFDPDDVTKNYIFAFKNNILIPEEYAGLDRDEIKKHSIGSSQYAFVIDHFQKRREELKHIPKNTEFFIEFLMNKPTITRDYKNKHGLVLIGYAPTKFKIQGGKVFSSPGKLDQDRNERYAFLMGLDTPKRIFAGLPKDYKWLKGGASPEFKKLLKKRKQNFKDADNRVKFFKEFKNALLELESVYGGTSEGVVIKQGDKIYKILQEDQHDFETRNAKKLRFKMSPEEENEFYKRVHKIADDLVASLDFNSKYEKIVKSLNSKVYSMKDLPKHTKKTILNIQDDVFLTAKTKLNNRLPGNNNALFIGRLQPPTKMHMKIIEEGLNTFDNVVIGIVKGKKSEASLNPFQFDLQERMIKQVFPKVEIIQISTGNILGILNKTSTNINAVLAGSDRVEGYKKQLKKNPNIRVQETKRDFSGVSGTKVRTALKNDDEANFKMNMHPNTWQFFNELKGHLFLTESSKVMDFDTFCVFMQSKKDI